MADWSYVFTDLATGRELATLPMVGVSFEEKLLDLGTLEGIIPTTDPAIRAQDPWSLVRERRTAVYVERDDEVVWGGIVWGVTKSQDVYGLKINAATWESWLGFALLQNDLNTVGAQLGAPSTVRLWVDTVQAYLGGNVGLQVVGAEWPLGIGGDGTGENRVAGQVYPATDLKPLQDLLVNWEAVWGVSIEWRVDVAKLPTGGYSKTLVVAEGSLADGRDPLALAYGVPAGNLLSFTDAADGTQRPTAVYGATVGTNPTTGAPQSFMVPVNSDNVGAGEISAGYPLLAVGYSVPWPSGATMGSANVQQAADTEMVDRMAQGYTLSNLTVLADSPTLTSYQVGDPCSLQITHPAYAEWPDPTIMDDFRLVGRKVTVGSGTTPDVVDLTVVPGVDRIPNSRTVSAELKRMASRLRRMELRAGL